MKTSIQERYIWIAGVILAGFIIQGQSKKNSDLEILTTSYMLQTQIQNDQMVDFRQNLEIIKSNTYTTGFEDGRSQAGIAFTNGRPMLDYTDGYHAALEQFSANHLREDEVLIRELEADIRALVKDE